MKKHLLLGLTAGLTLSAFAQLPVSTTAENKNIVLEEFTGIYCGFCPDGHKRANDIADANPGDVVLINIHTGSYANPSGSDPDFRTPFGSAIAGQSNLSGYPAGTVNRTVFAGSEMTAGGTAMGRGNWAAASTTTVGQASYVNVALEGTINADTRELTVDVEMYVTGSAPSDFNLNVALLQSHLEGPQSGATGNSAQILPNGNYEHNHMLRHLLTGQWGEVITSVSGSVITKQYTYTIPADLNGITYELGDLEIVAFIAEGQQNIISGATGTIEVTNLLTDNSSLREVTNNPEICGEYMDVNLTFKNEGQNPITSLKFEYDIDGGTPQTAMWNGNINTFEGGTHLLENVNISGSANSEINVKIIEVNGNADPAMADNAVSSDFERIADGTSGTEFEFTFTQDRYGSESTWEIKNDITGAVVKSGGPYSNLPGAGTEDHVESVTLSDVGCHSVIVKDSYGDGINSGAGAGGFKLKDANGAIVFSSNGQFTKEQIKPFYLNSVFLGVDELDNSFSLVPNPTSQSFTIVTDYNKPTTIEIFNGLGQMILQKESVNLSSNVTFDVSNYNTGIYFVKINTENGLSTQQLIIE
ncbi:MAG: Omp28-related outer membrane protein [Flavobacteriales bacterium]